MSKRRKRKGRGFPEWRSPAAQREEALGRAEGTPQSASDVTRKVFSKMPDEVSPDLSLRDREINAEVRRRLVGETAEQLEELVAAGKVSSYVDEAGKTHYYSTVEQAARADQEKLERPAVQEMANELPVSEIALNLAEHARPDERRPLLPHEEATKQRLLGDLGEHMQPERGMGGTQSPGEVERGLVTENSPREEFQVRLQDGTTRGLGGAEAPIGDLLRAPRTPDAMYGLAQKAMEQHGPADQERLDAAVAALDDEDRSDYDKALMLVRAYLGPDYAVKYEQLSEADRQRTLQIVLDAARGHHAAAEAKLTELEDKAVSLDRHIREVRQQIDPVEPYRRSELLVLLKLRPAVAIQQMMALSQHLHPLLDEANQGVISTDEMAAKIREQMA